MRATKLFNEKVGEITKLIWTLAVGTPFYSKKKKCVAIKIFFFLAQLENPCFFSFNDGKSPI